MKYKVLINYHNEVHIFYTHSKSDDKALDNCIKKLSKKVGYTYGFVRCYVRDGMDRWKVERR